MARDGWAPRCPELARQPLAVMATKRFERSNLCGAVQVRFRCDPPSPAIEDARDQSRRDTKNRAMPVSDRLLNAPLSEEASRRRQVIQRLTARVVAVTAACSAASSTRPDCNAGAVSHCWERSSKMMTRPDARIRFDGEGADRHAQSTRWSLPLRMTVASSESVVPPMIDPRAIRAVTP